MSVLLHNVRVRIVSYKYKLEDQAPNDSSASTACQGGIHMVISRENSV